MLPVILHDRMPVEQLRREHPKIYSLLHSGFPRSVVGKNRLHFCGVLCPSKEAPAVFLPRGMGGKGNIENARLTMKTLARYGIDVPERVGTVATDGGLASLAALIKEILSDYQSHGLYSQRIRIRTTNSGKPDWKRTLLRSSPYFDEDGTPIFQTVHGSRLLAAHESTLALIQARIILEIVAQHGWWLGIQKAAVSALSDMPHPTIPRSSWAAAIRRFKQFLYDDRSLELASLLISYLENQGTSLSGAYICGVPDFSAIWEHMLANTVENNSKFWNALLPKPCYIHHGGHSETGKGGVIDVVIETTDEIIVADAKYYEASSASTAPGFPDLIKQSFYAQSITEACASKKVTSIFVFPKETDNQNLEKIVFDTDRAGPLWLKDVFCVYVDIESIMHHYIRRKAFAWCKKESYTNIKI